MEDRKRRLDRTLVCCILSVCLTSGISGVAGDVTDGVVLTDLHKTVKRGNDVVLNCEFYKEPFAVYWKKGNDPEGGVDVVTWVDGREFSGYCMNNERCGMGTANYSLIIRDAQIADRGRYICRVSNYLGILIHNFTDLKIYAPPDEPYPTINECQTKGGSMTSGTPAEDCRILTNSTVVNITCSAFGFFPDVNLFFLHGTSKVTNIGSNGWGNEDGSKSKSITINARVSDRQYVCVASDVPGSTEERTAGVYVESYFSSPQNSDNASSPFEKTTANPNEADGRSGTNTAKIVVPILLILVVATAGVVFFWWRSRKRLARSHIGKRDVEESELLVQKVKVQGVVSFYELWLLAYDTPNDEMAKVYTALVKLGITNVKGQMDKGLVYDALCEWKERSYVRDQPQMLRDALEEVGLETRWQEIYDHVRQGNDVNKVMKVPEGTLEQILLDLKGKREIKKFLNNLLQRESICIQNETIGVAHGSEEDKGKSTSEEGNMAMENTVPVKEAKDTNDGKRNNEDSASANGTNDAKGNNEDSAPANRSNDGKGNNEDSAPANGSNDGKGNNEDSAPADGTKDGKGNNEGSAPANGTNDGKGNNGDSAPAHGTNDSKGNNGDSAPAHGTNDSKGNNGDSAPAHGTKDGKGNNEGSAPANGTNDGKGNNGDSAPANRSNDGKGNNGDSAPAHGTNDGNGNKEDPAPANGSNDGKGNKEDSAPANGTNDGKGNNEGSAPANGTNDGNGNNEDSAPANGTNDGKGNNEDPAAANRSNDGKGNNEDPAPANGSNDGKGNNEDPAPANGSNDGNGNNEGSAPANGTNDGKGNNEDPAPVNGSNDGKGNKEDSASAKETDGTHDGKGSKKDSHPAKESKQEEVFQHVQAMEEVEYTKGMQTLKEWNKRPFRQNPFVLVSLALERAGFLHISKTFFDGPVSFYELRSLMYNVNTPSLEKLRKTICELGVDATSVVQFGPQQIYNSLCQWKDGHPQVDQGKILHDALLRAGHEEAWSKILEQRKDKSSVSTSTFRKILSDVKDRAKIQQVLQKIDPDQATYVKKHIGTGFVQKVMEVLKEWNDRSLDENRMIFLSRSLENAKCQPIDRTFFYGSVSYFELWAMAHSYVELEVEISPLLKGLTAMGVPGLKETITFHELYHRVCEWKEEHSSCDQPLVMKVHLTDADLLNVWKHNFEIRCETGMIISNETLEHILWHLKTAEKIKEFLHKLLDIDLASKFKASIPIEENMRIALVYLAVWKEGPFDVNPVVLLSKALESAKCNEVAMTFFQVPDYLLKPIEDNRIKEFVHKLTGRHLERLADMPPVTAAEKISSLADENNGRFFDTQSLIRDWVKDQQCCNYEKRCKLDDMLINISRNDMAGFFGTVGYRKNSDPDFSGKVHPKSTEFNNTTIFDDDLIQLRMLMACLDENMEKFHNEVGIPLDVVGPNKQRSDNIDLQEWRDSHLQYTVKEIFSEITGLMADKTKVNFVTDQELDWLVYQVTKDEKVEKFTDKKKTYWRRSKRTAGKLRAILSLMSGREDGKSQPQFTRSLSQEGTDEGTAGSQEESKEEDISSAAMLQQLKLWRSKNVEKSCRKLLRSTIKSEGLAECIVNKTPREKVYEVEIVRAASHILMRDVYPVIEALGIDQKTISKYMRQCPVLEKGPLDLLLQICKSESYNRLDFCLTLTQMGYVDVARSLYLDHEMSTSELARIAYELNNRDQAKIEPLFKHLNSIPDELPEYHETDRELYYLGVLRTWKEKIRPVPYHYRRHIVDGLQAAGCSDLADDVLKGYYRQSSAEDNVIEEICSRIDDSQMGFLLSILELKPDQDGQDRKKSTKLVVSWVHNWMEKYDPSPKLKANEKFQRRKLVNDELVRAGFYELAHEIMILEYSRF